MKKLFVIVTAVSMILGSAAGAVAEDWNFYGSVRLDTFNVDMKYHDYNALGLSDTNNFYTAVQDESRIGARVNASDTLYGRFEYGAENGNVNLRLLYGRWDFGAGRLYVGRYYTPLSLTDSNQVFRGATMSEWGALYAGRQDGLKLTFLQGAVQIGAYDPTAESSALGTTQEYTLPKIEASLYYPLNNNLSLFGGAGYQSYKADDVDVDSHIFGAGARLSVGPFYISANAYTGQNVNEMAEWSYSEDGLNATNADPVLRGGVVYDSQTLGYLVFAGYKLNDTFTFEAGYGGLETDHDDPLMPQEDTAAAYYINCVITLAEGVTVTPEFSVFDAKTGYDPMGNFVEQPRQTVIGMKWQINF